MTQTHTYQCGVRQCKDYLIKLTVARSLFKSLRLPVPELCAVRTCGIVYANYVVLFFVTSQK